MQENIFVFYLDMPTKVKATSTHNADGTYTVFINSRLNAEQQATSYMHEIRHILMDDFASRNSIDEIERRCHDIA